MTSKTVVCPLFSRARTASSSLAFGASTAMPVVGIFGCITTFDIRVTQGLALPSKLLDTFTVQYKTPFGVSIYS